jgi:multiple sugar transport system substrate-binding protein
MSKVLRFAGICLMAALALSCSKKESAASAGSGTGTAASDVKPITIQFWNSWTGSDGQTLIEMVEKFNKENPWKITVNMDISGSTGDRLATSLPARSACEIFLGGTNDKYKYQTYLLDINDIWTATDLKESDFMPSYLSTGKIGNDLYLMPFQHSAYYLYYNKDLLKGAGLDPEKPPMSFEEWTTMAHKITNERNNVYGSGLYKAFGAVQSHLMEMIAGPAITEPQSGKYKAMFLEKKAEYTRYLKWAKALFDSGDNPLEDDLDSMFKANQVAILVNGPWLAAGAIESEVNFEMSKIFGHEPMGDVASFFFTHSASPEGKLAAERFVQWWYTGLPGDKPTTTGVGLWSLRIGFPGFYLPLVNSAEYQSSQRLKNLAQNDVTALVQITCPDSFKGFQDINGQVISPLAQGVIYGDDIDQALTRAQTEAEKIIVLYHGQENLIK